MLENLRGLARLGDRSHRLDERVEEGGLRDELAFRDPVPPPFGEQHREGTSCRSRDRDAEPRPEKPAPVARETDRRRDDSHDDR